MIRSVTHVTRNENGVEELSIERYTTLFQRLWYSVRNFSTKAPDTITDTWEVDGIHWRNKLTGEIPNYRTQTELFWAKRYVVQNTLHEEM